MFIVLSFPIFLIGDTLATSCVGSWFQERE